MKLSNVEDYFRNRKGNAIGEYKKSAVMILLVEENDETYIIFEIRSEKLRHQPGDICLPGGRVEVGETALEAAIRETMEELNVSRTDLEVYGEMDYFISPYGSMIFVFVGKLKKEVPKPNSEEVHQLLKVPLSFFIDHDPIKYEMDYGPCLKEDFPYHLIKGGRNYKFSKGRLEQYFYNFEDNIIWGFTAMIIKNFIELVDDFINK